MVVVVVGEWLLGVLLVVSDCCWLVVVLLMEERGLEEGVGVMW